MLLYYFTFLYYLDVDIMLSLKSKKKKKRNWNSCLSLLLCSLLTASASVNWPAYRCSPPLLCKLASFLSQPNCLGGKITRIWKPAPYKRYPDQSLGAQPLEATPLSQHRCWINPAVLHFWVSLVSFHCHGFYKKSTRGGPFQPCLINTDSYPFLLFSLHVKFLLSETYMISFFCKACNRYL